MYIVSVTDSEHSSSLIQSHEDFCDGNILGSSDFDIGVIARSHGDFSVYGFNELAVVGEIETVFKCEVDSLKVELTLENLRSLRDIEEFSRRSISDESVLNRLDGILYGNSESSSTENGSVLYDFFDMFRLYKRTCTVVNGDEFRIGSDTAYSVNDAFLTCSSSRCAGSKLGDSCGFGFRLYCGNVVSRATIMISLTLSQA